jgi:hypothetical protein
MPPSPQRPSLLDLARWGNVWTAVGGAASLVVFIYGLGAAIESMRLHHAGVPVEQAVAVIPKGTFASVAVDALFVPMLVSMAFSTCFVLYIGWWADRLTTPEAITQRAAKREAKAARKIAKQEVSPGALHSALSRASKWIVSAWRKYVSPSIVGWGLVQLGRLLLPMLRLLARFPHKRLLFYAVLYTFLLPWTYFSLILLAGVLFIQLPAQSRIFVWASAGLLSRRLEVTLLVAAGAAMVAATTLADEAIRPESLPGASLNLTGQAKPMHGAFIADTAEDVYMEIGGRLFVIPNQRVKQLIVSRARSRKNEKARTLLERLH